MSVCVCGCVSGGGVLFQDTDSSGHVCDLLRFLHVCVAMVTHLCLCYLVVMVREFEVHSSRVDVSHLPKDLTV